MASGCEQVSRRRTITTHVDKSCSKYRIVHAPRYCPKADPFHDCHHGIRRPEIPQINNLSFRKIFVINPIRRLVRTQITENKAAARTEYPNGITKHAGLGLKMVKGKLAADEIKAQVEKRERRGIGLHPSNVRRLGPSPPQHTK
jgi:hypothetical protein